MLKSTSMVPTHSREESIELRGVRTHNLRCVDVDIHRGAITAVVGLSGSGKSSLAVETLAAEGLRRHLFLRDPARSGAALPVSADLIRNLPPTYCFAGARSDDTGLGTTVAAYLGLWQVLVSLFVREGETRSPATGEGVRATSQAEMVERALKIDPEERLMVLAPLDLEAARLETQLDAARGAGFVRARIDGQLVRLDEREAFDAAREAQQAELVVDRVRGANQQRWTESIELALKWNTDAVRVLGDVTDVVWRRSARCPASGWLAPMISERLFSLPPGGALHPDAAAVYLWGHSSAQFLQASGGGLQDLLADREASDSIVESLLASVTRVLEALAQLGLDSICLGQTLGSLSTGQRNLLATARALSAQLRGALLVLDELSTGVHPDHRPALIGALRSLAADNTVVLVEHEPTLIEAAEYIVEVGPGAGEEGGRIVFAGPNAEFKSQDTITAQYLRTRKPSLPQQTRSVSQATDVVVEPGELVGLRSVGPQKSRLLSEVLAVRFEQDRAVARVVRMEDRQVVRSLRSVSATILGVMDPFRSLFAALPEARVRGYKAARFSFNVGEGRCEACEGTALAFADDSTGSLLVPPCPVCKGARYAPETCEVRYRGYSIADILEMSIGSAELLFASHPKIAAPLAGARALGVGYLTLGRAAQTLSNGELQRLWLAKELSKRARGSLMYLFDEPTSGLHPLDAERFVAAVLKLCRAGHAAVVASVDEAVLAHCARVYDCDDAGGAAA